MAIAAIALLTWSSLGQPNVFAQETTPGAVPGGAYWLCFEPASGGADHSQDPDPADYPVRAVVDDNGPRGMECRLQVAAAGLSCDASGQNCQVIDASTP